MDRLANSVRFVRRRYPELEPGKIAPSILDYGTIAIAIASITPFFSSFAFAHEQSQIPCRVLVVTFVWVDSGLPAFPLVEPVVKSLRDLGYPGVCVKTVSSYWPWSASQWVRRQFDAKRGSSTDAPPKLIVFGYSLGGSHAIRFARAMQRLGISIETLVTVDIKGLTDVSHRYTSVPKIPKSESAYSGMVREVRCFEDTPSLFAALQFRGEELQNTRSR
jgi:hypothetical protein